LASGVGACPATLATSLLVNYFAHGRRFIAEPYFLAGTAVPDWLSVVDRRVRARAKLAAPLVADNDPQVAALARGIIQHHADDDWFHRSRAFAELSLTFSTSIRDRLPGDRGFRPGFLGHILVEILLDAVLIDEHPQELDAYYDAMHMLDPAAVGAAVNRMSTRTTDRLPTSIHLFRAERFLYDYRDNEKLLTRLNHVMRRVGLLPLPASMSEFLPEARQAVRQRASELLDGEQTLGRGESP
jgi:hypothetical protein